MINKERMLAEFFELVKIKCSTRDERQVADVLKDRLAVLGMEVTEDNTGEKIGGNCGNVIAYTEGTVQGAPTIMLSAHMDCVEPCGGIEPQLKDGIITSVGDTILGADDKAGIAAILEALRIINENDIVHGPIQVLFTVSEEGGLNGAKNMDPSLLKADFGYALDSSGEPGEIIIMAPGQNSITAVVHGKKAHAGIAPEDGINSIVVAGKCLAEMNYGRIDFETTANIGIISGGNATNIVPDRVEVRCEARSRNMEKLESQTNHMKETFEGVAKKNGARAEVIVKKSYSPYVLPEDAPVVTLAVKAAQSIDLIPEITATGGGSDANYFNNYGVPTAVLGIGMNKVHTADEYIKEVDLYNSAELVIALIKTAGTMKK
ncbi:MAG: peptidase T-like protein [Firmicutes bacterium]|nr:peptidase T-like protein [Bacillota bacterium]